MENQTKSFGLYSKEERYRMLTNWLKCWKLNLEIHIKSSLARDIIFKKDYLYKHLFIYYQMKYLVTSSGGREHAIIKSLLKHNIGCGMG